MSDPVPPHRRQPTRLPDPLDSQGKNTGVGCHFILQCVKVKSESEVALLFINLSVCDSLKHFEDQLCVRHNLRTLKKFTG